LGSATATTPIRGFTLGNSNTVSSAAATTTTQASLFSGSTTTPSFSFASAATPSFGSSVSTVSPFVSSAAATTTQASLFTPASGAFIFGGSTNTTPSTAAATPHTNLSNQGTSLFGPSGGTFSFGGTTTGFGGASTGFGGTTTGFGGTSTGFGGTSTGFCGTGATSFGGTGFGSTGAPVFGGSINPNTTNVDTFGDPNTTSDIFSQPRTTLSKDILKLLTEEDSYADVTFEVEGKLIRAHKCILANRCPKFKTMFSSGFIESHSEVIKLPLDLKYDVFMFIIKYCYGSEEPIPYDICLDILRTSEEYFLQNLKNSVEIMLGKNLTQENVLSLLEEADLFSCDILKSACFTFILSSYEIISTQPAFINLNKNLLLQLLGEMAKRRFTR